MQKIYKYLEKGKKVAALLFDLSSAFDIVKHKCLEKTLEPGYYWKCARLADAYLSDRRITVSFGTETSSEADLDTGVGEESIVSPLLFVMLINDLSLFLPTHTFSCMLMTLQLSYMMIP